jgi:hypothetical protein
MPKLTLAGKSVADAQNLTPSSERLVNCYAYPAPEGAKAPLIIRSVPPLRDFSSAPGPFLRALTRVDGELYAVAAGGLWKIAEGGASTYLAEVPDDPNTTIAGHRTSVTVSADGGYYVWDGEALTEPGSGALDSIGSLAFLDQFTLMAELDGRRVEWTEVGDPEDRNGLYFATAEARDDKIVRIMEIGGYLGIAKQTSTELWGNTRLSGSRAWARIDGSVSDGGLKAFNLICPTRNGIFYIGNDNIAYLAAAGGAVQPFSPPNVVKAIAEGEPTHCFYYEVLGHQFCAIRFHDRPAWVGDIATGFWHERASGVEHKPWDVICSAYCYGQWHLGDRLGRVHRLGTAPVDGATPLRRMIRSRNLYVEGEKFSVGELELLGLFGKYDVREVAPNWITDQNGIPLTDQDGNYLVASEQDDIQYHNRAGQVWCRFSKDGGHTFGPIKVRNIGKVGQYRATAKFWALGQFEDMVAEINLTDPVDVPLLSEANVRLA